MPRRWPVRGGYQSRYQGERPAVVAAGRNPVLTWSWYLPGSPLQRVPETLFRGQMAWRSGS